MTQIIKLKDVLNNTIPTKTLKKIEILFGVDQTNEQIFKTTLEEQLKAKHFISLILIGNSSNKLDIIAGFLNFLTSCLTEMETLFPY